MSTSRDLHPSSPNPAAQLPRTLPTPVGRTNAFRVSLWTFVVALFVYGAMHLMGGFTGESVAAQALSFGAGLLLLPIGASPVEWFVHRFVYHDAKIGFLGAVKTVHTTHHYSYFPTWRYVTNGGARRLPVSRRRTDAAEGAVANASIRLSHFAWYMAFGIFFFWLPGWFLSGNAWFVAGLVGGSAVVSNLFIVVHDTIHRPGSHFIVEAQPWFRFLDNHHWIHHVDLGANLNFLLPLADALFGTLRTHMTDDELRLHGTLDDAKTRQWGNGEKARVA